MAWFPLGDRQTTPGGKYRAIPSFVTDDFTRLTRDDLLKLASYRHVPTSVWVKHRVGAPTVRHLTLRELAAALHLTGTPFASKLEADRFVGLRRDAQAGRIQNLRLQVRFDLHAGAGVKIGSFRADFVYDRDGQTVVEDAKGVRTREFKRTKQHMAAEYGIVVIEIRRVKNRLR